MVMALGLSVGAINLNVTAADIERALILARGRDVDRARFHSPYISNLDQPFVQRVEIITEFRRVVLLAEERLEKGDRMFAYSGRMAAEALSPWRNRVAIRAQLRFHPQNTYVDLPAIVFTLDGPSGEKSFIGLRKDPINALATGEPGERIPIMGAFAEAVYDASLIGQTRRIVSIRIDGKDVAKTNLDFGAVE